MEKNFLGRYIRRFDYRVSSIKSYKLVADFKTLKIV